MKRSILLLSLLTTSFANAITFYGLDNNTTGVVPMLNRPNHDSAKLAFKNAIGLHGENDLESLPVGGAAANLAFGVANATFTPASGAGVTEAQIRDTSIYEAFAFSGTKYFLGHSDPGVNVLTLTFDREIKSIGFSISDEADWGASSNPPHELVLGNGEVYGLAIPPYNISTGSASFFGVKSDTSFRTISIRYSPNGVGTGGNADALGIDDIIVAVPEPGSILVLGMGLILISRRKR